ncbi:GTP cyclohydrolase 1 [subsurface metagenome]
MNKERIEDCIKILLEEIEGKPIRAGTKETPQRVSKALPELFDGYTTDIKRLFKTFDGEGKDQIVAVRNIEFTSFCEHHILPFTGLAHIAYLPKDRVIGASKIPRLVMAFAHRLQLQERLTEQIANTLMQELEPQGVAVIIEGSHDCMKIRGVRCQQGKLITSVMLGLFRDDPVTKQEVLALLGLIR